MSNHDSNSTRHSTNTTSASDAPTHEDFHWIEGPQQGSLYGNLLETTLDVSAGIHACLQIIYTNTLEHAANDDADDGEKASPAVSVMHADQLMRLAIVSAGLLRDEAWRQVEDCNEVEVS